MGTICAQLSVEERRGIERWRGRRCRPPRWRGCRVVTAARSSASCSATTSSIGASASAALPVSLARSPSCSAPRRWPAGPSSAIGRATSCSAGSLGPVALGASLQQRVGQTNVTSLMERVSRFTVLLKNTTKRSKPVMDEIATATGALPFAARRSITFDQGSEFVTWPHLQAETGTQSWFCAAQSPCQKGAVENTNPRLRRFLSRKIDLRQLTEADIPAVTDRMNATPRKCLGWSAPAEVFAEKMVEIAGPRAYSRVRRKSHFT